MTEEGKKWSSQGLSKDGGIKSLWSPLQEEGAEVEKCRGGEVQGWQLSVFSLTTALVLPSVVILD